MKVLIAIESDKQGMQMAHTTLRWLGRTGYKIRIFIPDRRQLKKYLEAVDDANYEYYFDFEPADMVVPKSVEGDPMTYARKHKFDLLVRLPDDLLDWRTVKEDDKTFVEFAEDVGIARRQFGEDPSLDQYRLLEGKEIFMERVR